MYNRARHGLQILLILALISSCKRIDSVPSLPPLPDNAKILAFGDSLTYGSGAKSDQSYPAVLSTLSGRNVVNAGVPGETSAQGLRRLPELLDIEQPDLLILCLGGNDMLRKQSRESIRGSLIAMIQMVRRKGIPLVLLGVPEPAIFSLHSAPVFAELAAEFNLPIENQIIADVLSDSARKADQIHPNAQGYRDMAQAIHALLKKAGAY